MRARNTIIAVIAVAVLVAIVIKYGRAAKDEPTIAPSPMPSASGPLERLVPVKLIAPAERQVFLDDVEVATFEERVIIRGMDGSTHELKVVTEKRTLVTAVKIIDGKAVPDRIDLTPPK